MAFKLYQDKTSLKSKYSRFVTTGTAVMDGIFLGWWEKKHIPSDPNDDIEVLITTDVAYRPDKISKLMYDRDDLGPIVLQYNNIIDINEELAPGKVIVLPSYDRMFFNILVK